VVARDEAAASGLRSLEDLIRDELNVKSVEISLDESSFVTYKAKANFQSLGKRLGKAMKDVASRVATLTHDEISAILGGVPLQLAEAELRAEDLQVIREVSPELAVAAVTDLTVALDTAVDEPLRLEMLAREAVSRIQNLRKESGLAVTDRVAVVFEKVSPLLLQAVETHRDYITAEVLADAVSFDGAGQGASTDMEVEGESARIFVRGPL
jgi:isoleucyl-tRNA synthetase